MNGVLLVVFVSAAGGAGAVARFLVDHRFPVALRERYPWGTNTVNVTGSFLLGMVTARAGQLGAWGTVIGAGLLGGYTTFSTASLETVILATGRRTLPALANSLGMLAACVAAAAAGLALAG